MVRTQISLEPDTYEQAKDEARRRGISFAELVRKSLGETLKPRRENKPWMRYAGMFDNGDPDSSSTIDEVVYGREQP
jgi:hypothetical protein